MMTLASDFILVLLSVFHISNSQEILGCGGFVKSEVGIDFSQIEIKLLTSDGIVKYQTECAPNNGYFMVPFVDKGDFILKIEPPQGWKFEPTSVDLHIDGVNDPCTKGKDINFSFKGFMLSGQILTVGSTSYGPDGVKVALTQGSDKATIAATTTTKDGNYVFEAILPGKYQVVATHESYTFQKHQTEVIVSTANTKCPSNIVVSGFNVHGHVTAQKLPVAGVHLLLFGETKLSQKLAGCSPTRPTGANDVRCDGRPHFLCVVTSDADGRYTFPSLPPADYAIIPFHRGEFIQFDVEPRELKFTIQNSKVNHKNGFKVTGFSVQGRVLDSANGKPVEGAKVMIGKTEQGMTNKEGYYTLKHMHSGVLDVAVVKDNIEFPITKMRVGPDTPLLPSIVASSFTVCGIIIVTETPSGQFSMDKIKVQVTKPEGGAVVMSASVDEDGQFCAMLKPGKYVLKPALTKSMQDNGLVLIPPSLPVTVVSQPIKTVEFAQYHGSVKVQVTCIEACKDVKVELTSARSGKKTKQIVTANQKKAKVDFSGVLPGKYSLTASHDNWCWQADSAIVVVPSGDRHTPPTAASFEQNGFKLVCSISHDVEMKIHYTDSKFESFPLKKGHNQLCLSRAGEYLLEPVSCHRFDVQTPLRYNTGNPRAVTLHAVAHHALVAMETTRKLADPTSTHVMIRSSQGKVTKEHLTLSEDNTNTTGTAVYKFSYWAGDGERLEFTPSSDLLLFEPATAKVTMQSSQCAKELIRFRGIVGIFLAGKVTPALSNVDITIATVGSKATLGLKTNSKGKYKVGPLHPDKKYDVIATMDNYVMTRVDGEPGSFVAKKLSKLIFKIQMDSSDEVIPGVLLSISGGDYRSNNLTGANGSLVLSKLEPGQYYFKAMMKEYQFDPSSQMLDVKEGANTVISISGKRTAYSVLGTVTSLNGEPEPDVTVRATSQSNDKTCAGLVEEAVSGKDGSYRVRGLRPGCHYDVTVRDAAQRFSHVTPASVELVAKAEDVNGMRFIGFRQLTGFELSGNVVTSLEYLPFVKMALYRANDTSLSAPVHSVSLSRATPFFHLPTLARDGSEYVLRLECSLAKSMYEFTAPAAGFFAVGPHKHITFRFDPEAKKLESEVPQVSLLTLPLTALVILLAYNYSKVLQYLQSLVSAIGGKREANEPRIGRKQRK